MRRGGKILVDTLFKGSSKKAPDIVGREGSPFQNVVTGLMSPFMQTPKSKKATQRMIEDSLADKKVLHVGHSEGGQNAMRAAQRSSVLSAIDKFMPIGVTNSDGTLDEEFAVPAMTRKVQFESDVEKAMKRNVTVATLGSPSVVMPGIKENAWVKDQIHMREENDMVSQIIGGLGEGQPFMDIFKSSKPGGGHGHDENYADKFKDIVMENSHKVDRVDVYGGMGTSQTQVQKRIDVLKGHQ